MIPFRPATIRGKLKRSFVFFFMQAAVLSAIACHSPESVEENRDAKSEIERMRQKLVTMRNREKTLKQENSVARNPEPYLLINLPDREMALKARGRILRTFKIRNMAGTLENLSGTAQVLSEVRSLQKIERPRIKAGDGEASTVEAAQKMLWGLHQMPPDFDLVCQDGVVFEFRSMRSKQSVPAPVRWIRTLFQKSPGSHRQEKSPEGAHLQSIQLWLEEKESQMLFWSLPRQLKILVIATAFQQPPAGS